MEGSHLVQQVKIGDTKYFKKTYRNSQMAEKVRAIHRNLQRINFAHAVPIAHILPTCIVQRWLEPSNVVDYAKRSDRQKTFEVLRKLHQTNTQVGWESVKGLSEQPIVQKWAKRLSLYEQQSNKLPDAIQRALQPMILQGQRILNEPLGFSNTYTLCHGDVAHHNFLVQNQHIYIIDFDLAYLGPADVELICWAQRVLPHIHYKLDVLLHELPSWTLSKTELLALQFPNELLREALYLTRLKGKQREKHHQYLERQIEIYVSNEAAFRSAIKNAL